MISLNVLSEAITDILEAQQANIEAKRNANNKLRKKISLPYISKYLLILVKSGETICGVVFFPGFDINDCRVKRSTNKYP